MSATCGLTSVPTNVDPMTLPSPSPDTFALVTGASQGIGMAMARDLASMGHNLIVVARREAVLRELADALEAAHGVTVEVVAADLSKHEEVSRVIELIDARPVNILINSAGIATFGDFTDLDYGGERAQFELNATALFELTAAVLPRMLARGEGGIVNVGSAAGNMAIPGNATYVGTKAMVNTYTEALHYELKPKGIKCTLLAPGPVREEVKEEEKKTGVDRAVPDFVWTTY